MKYKLLIGILFTSFIITGCFFGDVGSGYITKTCIKIDNYDDTVITSQRKIRSKDNNVISIIFINSLESSTTNTMFKSIKNSYISEANVLDGKGVKTEVITDTEIKYEISYYFDFSTIDTQLKEKYNFDNLNHNQIKKYQDEGYECK